MSHLGRSSASSWGSSARERAGLMMIMAESTWYAVQTYSGHENKVQKLIQRRIEEQEGSEDGRAPKSNVFLRMISVRNTR